MSPPSCCSCQPPQGYAPGPYRELGPPLPLPEPQPDFQVDREKTCPLLLRVFTRNGGHHKLDEFAVRGKEPSGEIQIYTWMDATLRELSDLIKEKTFPW
ncbi:uncharacterized protein HaLaN_26935 [Haematococcus lacustris]|uniref:Histone deacetylase complex subunit SAP18 n=1 Tax=Haematococcus lacustris TaxID=44745 RepID=A0A6A0A8A3_HAELA|nr:uncharacterized protein HaLaN_26935 [Haematococcus lacustris]